MVDLIVKRKFAQPVDREAVAADWDRRGYSCGLFVDPPGRWDRRGYSCGLFVDPPGREWNDFVHTTNELVTVAEGRLELTVGETRLLAEPGDEVFIPRHCRHSVKNVHDGTTRWLFGYD